MTIKLLPDKKLTAIIDSYWIVDQPVSGLFSFPMTPCGYPIIEFNLREPWILEHAGGTYVVNNNVLIGITDQPIILKSRHHIKSVLIRLKPWAMPLLKAKKLKNNCVHCLSEVFNGDMFDTQKKLEIADSPIEFKEILDEFANEYLAHVVSNLDERVIFSINYILEKKGNIVVSDLVALLDIGQKRLEQLFKLYIGHSPKTYAKIAKINYAFSILNKSDSLTHLSLDAGYYDQSHFIGVCKKMSGLTPSTFIRDKEFVKHAHISNLYNF